MSEPSKRLFDAWKRSVPTPPREEGRARFLAALAEPRPAERKTARYVALAGVLAAAAALVIWWRTPPPALHYSTAAGEGVAGAWLATDRAELDLSFSEGTHVVLAEDSRGRVEELGRAGASFVLERGEVRASVTHRTNTDWRFRAGPFEVQVTGTKLDVGWDPTGEKLAVRVDEGAVVVRGPVGSAQVVRAGERYVIDLPARTTRLAPIVEIPDAGPTEDASVDAPPASASSAPVEPPRVLPSWTKLAARGDYDGAYGAAQTSGIASVLRASSADELLRFAQVSQLSGHRDTEKDALLMCRKRFPASEQAAVAAYELGRGAPPAEAGPWFDAYLAEQPSGPLAREAAGRALESKANAGDRDGARAAADRYLARYPTGPHAALAQRILSSP